MSEQPSADKRLADAYMNLYTAACRLRQVNEDLHDAERKHRLAMEAIEELEEEHGK